MLKRFLRWWAARRLIALETRYTQLRHTLQDTQEEMAAVGNELSRRRDTFPNAPSKMMRR